ncbi:hypothetical protein EGM87_22625 [Sphingobium sp. RSMS]|uniref:hypothetical protein n=1 Tax=Sphingobium sp. RSMS TaxID=520734 RepID=UPI0010F4E9C2|nr:hypothetical protein [Sphingobium sp. RSMS]UXC93094.1 hypothetical protein EGM87_22625 [Sphingobium sp. RSMS]
MTHPTDTAKSDELKPCKNPHLDADPRDEAVRTIFAETAIMMTHPDDERRALAKERVYSLLFARPASSPPQNDAGGEGLTCGDLLHRAREIYWQYMEEVAAAKGDSVALGEREKCLRGDLDHQHGVQIALRALMARTPSALQALGQERETTFEVWQGDMMVASSTDEAEARHYCLVYSQDGPVRLVRAETVRTPLPSAPSGEG